jgi:hypothetical protein
MQGFLLFLNEKMGVGKRGKFGSERPKSCSKSSPATPKMGKKML